MQLPESAHRLFERPFDAVLTTINPDGSPQTLLIEDHDERNAKGLPQYLLIRGRASIEGPGIPDEFTALMDRQARRFLGAQRYELGNEGSTTAVIVRIAVERVGGVGPWA